MTKVKNLIMGTSSVIVSASPSKTNPMLLTIGLLLIGLWLVGIIVFPLIGWVIHILLVVAVIVILLRIIRGNK